MDVPVIIVYVCMTAIIVIMLQYQNAIMITFSPDINVVLQEDTVMRYPAVK